MSRQPALSEGNDDIGAVTSCTSSHVKQVMRHVARARSSEVAGDGEGEVSASWVGDDRSDFGYPPVPVPVPVVGVGVLTSRT